MEALAARYYASRIRHQRLHATRPWLTIGVSVILIILVLAVAAVILNRTLVFCVASVLMLLALAAWRLRAAVAALLPLPPLTVLVFHSLTPTVIAIAAVSFAVLLEILAGHVSLRWSHLWVAALGGTLLLSWIFPTSRLESSGLLGRDLLATGMGLLALAIAIVAAPAPSVLLRVQALVGALVSLYALTHGDLYGDDRIGAMALNPNYLGAYLTLPIVASLALAFLRRNPFWLAVAAVCVVALMATKSRGASLGALAGIIFLMLQDRSRSRRVVVTLTVLVAFAVSLNNFGAIVNIGAGNRPDSELVTDTAVRSHVTGFLLNLIASHPLRGVGFGQFSAYAAASPRLGIYIAATDEYLLIAAESGLLALAVLIYLIWRGLASFQTGYMAAVRAVAFTYAINMLFLDTLGTLLSIVPFWLYLGLLIGSTQKLGGWPLAGQARNRKKSTFPSLSPAMPPIGGSDSPAVAVKLQPGTVRAVTSMARRG